MFKSDNQLDMDSPYVLLTTKEPEGITGSDSLLLTLQEGNLISFSEKKISGEGGETSKNPTVFIKFLDPEMTFIPRWFDKSIIELYKNYFNQLGEATGGYSNADYITVDELEKIKEDNLKNETVLQGRMRELAEEGVRQRDNNQTADDIFYKSYSEEVLKMRFTDDTSKESKILKEINKKLSETQPTDLWLQYGNGTSTKSAWRKFVLASFYITQDSSNNMMINLTASEHRLENAESGAIATEKEVINYFDSSFKDVSFVEESNEIKVPILELTPTQSNAPIYRGTGAGSRDMAATARVTYVKRVTYYGEDLIISLLENLYQKFLLSHSDGTVLPFVFLSPKIPYLLKTKIDEIIKGDDNSGTSVDLGNEEKRFQILHSILNSCDISTVRGNNEGQGGNKAPIIYYLELSTKSTKTGHTYYENVVLKSIMKLYRFLDLTEGGYPMDTGESTPLVISNNAHKELFIKQFCELLGSGDRSTDQFTNNYMVKEEDLREQHVVNNIKRKISDLSHFTIKVYTDYVLGNGLITPFSSSYSNSLLDLYTEKLRLPFKNSSKAVKHSNAFKFLFGNEGNNRIKLLFGKDGFLSIKDYILEVSNIYEINSFTKTNFDYSTEVKELKGVESLPVFISNRKDANVFEVVSTEKLTGFAKLLESFRLIKRTAENTLSGILSPSKETSLVFSPERLDKTVDSMFLKVLGNNAAAHTLLAGLGELSDTIEIDQWVRNIFESIITDTRDIISKSNHITDRKISYTGLTAHLNYIQNLSNHVAMVSIKTIPFFNYTDPIVLGKPCLFLNNTNFHALTRGIPIAGYLSGIYLMSGYEHVISDSECYSKFTIQKQQILTDSLQSLNKKPGGN